MRERLASVFAGVTRLDVGIAAALFALALADTLTTTDYEGGRVRLVVAATLQTVPLVVRRTRTVLAAGLSLLGVVVEVAGVQAYGGIYGLIGFLLLVHAVSRWTTGAQTRTGLVILVAGAAAHLLSQNAEGPLGLLGATVMVAVFSVAAWQVGAWPRRSERDAERWHAESAATIEAERARISRDLHDVVGHALAGISLTAGAAQQQTGARDPEMASALTVIRDVSRDAAEDVRRLVGLLREGSAADVGPQPTLDDVGPLVARARETGMNVRLEVEGLPRIPSRGLQLAAYRVVQEALTNAARHGGDGRVTVALEWLPAELRITVTSPTVGRPTRATTVHRGPASGGHGLVGLRERVALYGGDVDVEEHDGEFVLSARLPIP